MENKKLKIFIISLVAVGLGALSGTIAFLSTSTADVKNKFTPTEVTCAVTEDFTNNVKSNVNAVNTGDINAYIRINLISYRVNEQGERIGGEAVIEPFELNEGWVKGADGYYYYTKPVAPGERPEKPLTKTDIELEEYEYVLDREGDYKVTAGDADGGRQVIEVMAEAVQADGGVTEGDKFIPAVDKAWGTTETEFSVAADGTLSVSAKQ